MIGRVFKLGRGVARLVVREVSERLDRAKPSASAPATPEHAQMQNSGPSPTNEVGIIEVHDLRAQLEGSTPPVLLDCREIHEWEAGYIDGSVHIPMNDLPERHGELDPTQPTVVYCLHGMRSAEVAGWLQGQKDFTNVLSLDGGIVSWYAEFNQDRIIVTRSEDH